ncbi:hypothetical protein GOP47_0023337 [Adiantum capillus-veneris]|uniref:Uncharacterized protein n=1 Tax=Adiantum capillus-veneris TaxID=13818 RepID=A0A9D4Z516_ADICA|nr:hypothetical protein GOP47_0023337 [Adiantum capillus-veneris]
MAEHDDLDGILDSALDDFRANDGGESSNPRVSEETKTLGQGLGLELPALGPRERRGGLAKAKSNGKTSSTSRADKKSTNGGRLSDTLEELAQQTRQTLEGMETKDQEDMADKLVESIVKQFEELGSSEDMQGIMDTMMQQLLSKEVLHEPMKEFCEKYPNWLEVNKSSLSDEDFRRYSRQYEYIKELCGVYESIPDDFSRIVDIMQNMQTCGQPPDDLVQELGPGMDLKGDGLPFLSDLLKEGNQSAGANQNCSMM